MVSPKLNPQACWEFEGEILVLHHPTTISVKYQAMGMFVVLLLDQFLCTLILRELQLIVGYIRLVL